MVYRKQVKRTKRVKRAKRARRTTRVKRKRVKKGGQVTKYGTMRGFKNRSKKVLYNNLGKRIF